MPKYDFKRAKEIINASQNLQSASLGMHEDWGWTSETIWENGEFTKDLDTLKGIAGICGSSWATPTIELLFKDGRTEAMPCHDGGKKLKRTEEQALVVNATGGRPCETPLDSKQESK